MKHELKFFANKTDYISVDFAVEPKVYDRVYEKVVNAIMVDFLGSTKREEMKDPGELLVHVLDQIAFSDWEPLTPNDYFVLGIAFGNAISTAHKMLSRLRPEKSSGESFFRDLLKAVDGEKGSRINRRNVIDDDSELSN